MNSKREEEIKKARLGKITQQETADKLGITRQRVQQIERKIGLGPRRIPGVPTLHSAICESCFTKFETKTKNRKFCSRECFFKSKLSLLPPELREEKKQLKKEKNRIRAFNYYHDVFKAKPEWREIVKKRNKSCHTTH
jgi:transcriptional regulator with XRE-family HTH domain